MAKNCNAGGLSVGHMIQAVSDGELNMSTRACGGSSSSLPGAQGGDVSPTCSVLSWAVSFEKLLEDPCGVDYFTSFLRSEVSAENILFWQACEKFRKIPATSLEELKAEARSIYDTYLSDSAPYSVNIDDTVKVEEKDLEQPTPVMFNDAQAQIFKLMKMDSYRRFVHSPLYQSCTLASVDGKALPQPMRLGSREDVAERSPTSCDKKNKMMDLASEKRHQKTGSWGELSVSNVELGFFDRRLEDNRLSRRSLERLTGVEGGYCCVFLPDGSASLVPTRNGQTIKDMLASLCEKRGFPIKDVIIYLHGKDKQPLLLGQDCSVLRDQQVSLELRVTFLLEIAFTGKTVGIMVKSSKTLQDALTSVLQRHHLKQQDVSVTIVGSDEPVSMTTTAFKLVNKTIRLDITKGRAASSASGAAAATQGGPVSARGAARSLLQTESTKMPSKNRDMDGLLDMLTRAQCHRVEDQRGLLTKEQLEIPVFLQLTSEQGQDMDKEDKEINASSPPTADCKEDNLSLTASSAGVGEESPAAPKDSFETTV
ncbi:regulator of G-protein signaling 14 isoform X2 [Antennarius striatus]|uniref:regulator of G-protein signaling 14 isoform X2 n=1 Tax=Antennarius striatus TaxID=241820 RepID=UPI0035AF95E7